MIARPLTDEADFGQLLARDDFVERLLAAIGLTLPPPFLDRPPGSKDGQAGSLEGLSTLKTVCERIHAEVGGLGRALRDEAKIGDRFACAAFAGRYRKSLFLWAMGYLPYGTLASAAAPDLIQVVHRLRCHFTKLNQRPPARLLDLRALIGTEALLRAVAVQIGPERNRQSPFAQCAIAEESLLVEVPGPTRFKLGVKDDPPASRLGWGNRLGQQARLRGKSMRITLTANTNYFQGGAVEALPDWSAAVACLLEWMGQLVPAGVAWRIAFEMPETTANLHDLGLAPEGQKDQAFRLGRGLSLRKKS